MNVKIQPKLSDEESNKVVMVQPAEFIPGPLPYQISKRRRDGRVRFKTGHCSRESAETRIFQLNYPAPDNCSSSAEVLLKSYMQLIRKQQFWSGEAFNQSEDFDGSKLDGGTIDGLDKDDKESTNVVIECSEVDERRQELASFNTTEKIKVLIQCIPLTRMAYGDHSFDHAEALVNLAQAYLDWKGFYKQATLHCEHAKSIINALSSNESVQNNKGVQSLLQITMCRLLLIEGKCFIGLKQLDKAEGWLDKAQNILDTVKKLPTIGEGHITWFELRCSLALASLCKAQESFGQAKSYIQTALDIEKKKLAAIVSDDVAELPAKQIIEYLSIAKHAAFLMRYLGDIERMRGKAAYYDDAIKSYKESRKFALDCLVVKVKVEDQERDINGSDENKIDELREDLKRTASLCSLSISKCYLENEKFDMAESEIKVGMTAYSEKGSKLYISGGKDKLYLAMENQLVKCLLKMENHDEAIDIIRSSLPLKRTLFGDYSFSVLEACNILVSLYLIKSEVNDAVKFLQKCVEISTARYGKNDNRTKNAEMTLSMLMTGHKDQNSEKRPLTFRI